MKRVHPILLASLALLLAAPAALADKELHTFKKIKVSGEFLSEGACFADFNKDGKVDVASGPYWYEGPDFQKKHLFYKPKGQDPKPLDPHGYSENFFSFTYDFNNDGNPDILVIGFPGEAARWYENPGKDAGPDQLWKEHVAFDSIDNESPNFVDLLGTGKPVIICSTAGKLGYIQPDYADAAKKWTFHAISPKGGWQRFTHGIGYGDINGDGKLDLLEKDGWWEQPASLDGDPVWTKHAFNFGSGGAQMYAYDVNGDGKNDVITSLEAHGYGLAWYEQIKDDKGQISFKQHLIMGKLPQDSKYGVKFTQPHAIDLIDINGDGLKDIVTGKRWWAHAGGDPEVNNPAVLYWFELKRGTDGAVDFIPHLIDEDSGVGTQVMAGNVMGGKFPDIVVGNKKGTFVHVHETKSVSDAEWEAAQPKPVAVPAKTDLLEQKK